MFQPPAFKATDLDAMHDLMRRHNFAAMVTGSDPLNADHLPFVLKDGGAWGRLHAHLAKANPMVRTARDGDAALVLFQGPQTYVTPSWYPSKAETGRVVPTWNYMVVQARGTLKLIDDASWLLDHLHDLTDQHEKRRAAPWSVADAPDDFMKRQLRGIVGVEIEITALDGQFKLSQNKQEPDHDGVVEGLIREGTDEAQAVARYMTSGHGRAKQN